MLEHKKSDDSCNMCGESIYIKYNVTGKEEKTLGGIENIQVVGGYFSEYLLDMNCYTFSLCEKCLRQLFMQFKVPPHVCDINFSGTELREIPFVEDQKAYEYMTWQRNGGHHQAYLNAKCNMIKECSNDAKYSFSFSEGHFSEDCSCEEHKDRYKNVINAERTNFLPNHLRIFI